MTEHSPGYWLPRACPRILTRASPRTSLADRERFLGVSPRVHAIEYSWLAAIQSTELYAYRFDRSVFRRFGSPEPHAYVATEVVCPLGPPEKVGPLLQAHAEAGIELRLFANLWPYWTEVTRSTLSDSGIRLPKRAAGATCVKFVAACANMLACGLRRPCPEATGQARRAEAAEPE